MTADGFAVIFLCEGIRWSIYAHKRQAFPPVFFIFSVSGATSHPHFGIFTPSG